MDVYNEVNFLQLVDLLHVWDRERMEEHKMSFLSKTDLSKKEATSFLLHSYCLLYIDVDSIKEGCQARYQFCNHTCELLHQLHVAQNDIVLKQVYTNKHYNYHCL